MFRIQVGKKIQPQLAKRYQVREVWIVYSPMRELGHINYKYSSHANNPKICMKSKKSLNSQSTLEREEQSRRHHAP